jgi:D-alanine-D-alanine ligase
MDSSVREVLRIVVLLGGSTEEREVSLSSGVAVSDALREAGHDVLPWDTLTGPLSDEARDRIRREGIPPEAPGHAEPDLIDSGSLAPLLGHPDAAGADLVFPVLHGGAGEDGRLQTLLELSGVPFAGSDRVGCMLAMDKDLTKILLRDQGIPTADWFMVEAHRGTVSDMLEAQARSRIEADLGYPCIVKPPSGGSTVGLTVVHGPEELRGALEVAAALEERIMVEAFVRGQELTVGILDDEPLAVGEIIPKHEIFDYECKYQPGMAEEIFPADVPEDLADHLKGIALAVHRTLRLADFSRVDFILDERGTPSVLEANTLPGMSPSSLYPKAGRAAGLDFPALCDRIARSAVARAADRAGT